MYNTILTRGQLSSVYRGIYKVKSLTMHMEYNYKYESLPVKESSGTASTPSCTVYMILKTSSMSV